MNPTRRHTPPRTRRQGAARASQDQPATGKTEVEAGCLRGILTQLAETAPSLTDRSAPMALTPALPPVATAAPLRATKARVDTTMGCRTSDVSARLLTQLVRVLDPKLDLSTREAVEAVLPEAFALIAELAPTSAMEALLAVQLIGAQQATMEFLSRALHPAQASENVDANISRATRLMRVSTELVNTYRQLPGKSGQQRVVVEHVTVAAGGQAIVGTVEHRGAGESAGASQ
jgi:hypothetical protein